MHCMAVGCIFYGNNRRPPIMCCTGRWMNTTDSVNTDHSEGKKTWRRVWIGPYVPSNRRDLLGQRWSVTTRKTSIFNTRKYVDHCLFSPRGSSKGAKKKWKVGTRNSKPCIRNRLELHFGWRKQETPTEVWCWYSKYVYCHCVFLKDIK
jgi:hypothetical protein